MWSHELKELLTRKKKDMENQISQMLQWISIKARGLSRQHLEGIGASVVIFAFIYVTLLYRNRKRKVPRRTLHRSMTLAALHGGRMAMQRILDAQHARIDASVLDGAEAQLRDLLQMNQLNLNELQSVVAKLEMCGEEDKALKMLEAAVKKAKEKGNQHEAYELDMLLVEMLIYKGNYIKALDRPCLKHQEISDARRPLYKTMVQIILGNGTLAKECWDEFQVIRSQFEWPDSFHNGPQHSVTKDFDEFEKAVNHLKKEIEHSHSNKNPT